jgi:uncharacterized protein (TIGR00730 family)
MQHGLNQIGQLEGDKQGVSIFATARSKKESAEYKQAYRFGYRFGKAGLLVFQGGGPGGMEGSAEGVAAAGGQAVSVCLKLPHEEKPNPYGVVNLEHQYFATRKAMFLEHSIGFVVLKGGFGTLDELFEALVHIQCRMTRKVPVYLVGKKFWTRLDSFIKDSLLEDGMISEGDLDLYRITDDEDEVVDGVVSFWQGLRVA